MIEYGRFNGIKLSRGDKLDLGYWKNFHDKRVIPITKDFNSMCEIIYLDFIDSRLFDIEDTDDRKFYEDQPYTPKPFIFIGFEDLFSESDSSLIKGNYLRKLNIPLYYRFLDDSIWNQYLFILDPKFDNKLILALERIKSFYDLGLYGLNVAKEYIEYNTKILDENELANLKGHGTYVVPNLFHSESLMRSQTKIGKDLKFFYPEVNPNENPQLKGVVLRILLIDDKIGERNKCKATLIKKLLSFDWIANREERNSSMMNVCWKTPNLHSNNEARSDECELMILDRIIRESSINDKQLNVAYKDKKNEMEFTLSELANTINSLNQNKIQIIAVKALDAARELLSLDNLRFDLIMMDYLLDDISEAGQTRREYATEFWGDGNEKYFEIKENDLKEKVKKGKISEDKYEFYLAKKDIYAKIKANRGPMQRLWIFPITAFNQTFIDDLRDKGVRLIDYYWYLSRGADPINTPYLFIYNLNMFLQLQLENAFFSEEEITIFVKKTTEKLDKIENLDDFNSFMGAEYTIFAERYLTRAVTYRDQKAGSLFATYLWENFYKKDEFKSLFILVQKMQKFYHCCAFGTEADLDKMIILQRELNIYIKECFKDSQIIFQMDKFYQKIIEIKVQI